jgi:hypothetical protein
MRVPVVAALCAALKITIFVGIGLSIGACSSTPADLEAKAPPIVQTYTENYQEIYRRVSTTAKRCFAGNVGAYASFAVDSELYSVCLSEIKLAHTDDEVRQEMA